MGRWLFNSGEQVYEVEVEGVGDSPEQARENGFRLAVQHAVGSLNLRQTERDGDRITQDRQIIYSSGFIRDWRETRSYRNSGGQWAVVMTVWVRHSSIADGLIGKTQVNSASIDGARQANIVQSRDREQQDAARLLAAVLEPWPLQALQIEHEPLRTVMTVDSRVQIVIPNMTIHWDLAHQKSLRETLDRISLRSRGEFWSWWSDRDLWSTRWAIRTEQQDQMLYQAFSRHVDLRVKLMQGNRVIAQQCIASPRFYTERQDTRHGGANLLPPGSQTIKNLGFYVERETLAQVNGIVFDLVHPNMCR